ncbi:hypothetical protein DNTS_001441 [Danionella cerebrum]|uniref:Uncharacterized protein n=1 Tax=Danionella cerebrum TaxID=2873325 RepID=A0A553R4C2_9TELE|nr:hypothetical protein DNTS_001441 [Danionella translucida]
MKKIFNFKKKKGSPSASETASVLSSNYDIKEKDLGKVHKAAFNGDLAKLRQLAKKNDLNQLDKENRTPLHIACSCGHTEVVQFLLENKVKLNLCDNQNRSALMKAVQSEQERCVSLLLEHEADPDLLDLKGDTALHHCARMPSISTALLLLEHSANINAQNKDGNTPLMLAVLENHVDMAELLLKEGADVNVKNQEERSALMIAACCGHISMVRLLLQYNADITIIDVKGWSSDDYAVMNGHHACSHLILEHGAKNKSHKSPSNSTTKRRRQTNLGSPSGIAAALAFGGPAVDKEATEDNSITDSISRASKSGAADSWPSSDDDDDMDLSPKEKKINLKKLISTSKREKVEVKVDRNADKSWSESESDPEIDESDGVKHPLQSKAPLQPLLETPPTLLAHPPQMTSTPFNHTVKQSELSELPSCGKLDEDENDSQDDESEEEEEEEDDEDDDDEEQEEEDEEEDLEEDDEEGDDSEEEDIDVPCEEPDEPSLTKLTTPDTPNKGENVKVDQNLHPAPENEMELNDSVESDLKNLVDQGKKEMTTEKLHFDGAIEQILNVEGGCLVSAIRVEASRASLCSVERTSQTNEEELLRTSQGETVVCEDAKDQDVIPQGQAELDLTSPNPKVVGVTSDDDNDWDDVSEEEEVQPKKPLNLFLTLLKEPESPEVSWESGSNKSDLEQEGDQEPNLQKPNADKDQELSKESQSLLREKADQNEESEAIPVSMIAGDESDEDHNSSHGEDSEVKEMQYEFASGKCSDVSDDESMLEEDDGPQLSKFSNVIQEQTISSSPPLLSTPKPTISQAPGFTKSSQKHCSPPPSTFIHLPSQSLDKDPENMSPNPQAEDAVKIEFTNDFPIEQEDLKEEIPTTIIDEVDLSSDSDGEVSKEEEGDVLEERCSEPESKQEEVLNNDDEEEEEDNGEQEKCSSRKENQRVVRNDDEEKEVDKEFKSLKRENVSVLSQLMDSKEAQKKTDLMEELGLGDADDLEACRQCPPDASDWDSASTTSKASKNLPVHNLVEEPISESLEASTLPETQQQQEADTEEHKETSPERNTAPLPSPRSLKPNLKPQPLPRVHSDSNNKPENEESDWDTDSSCSAEPKPSPPNATKAETAYRQEPVDEDVKSEISFDEREPADEAREASHASSVDRNSSSTCDPLRHSSSPREDQEKNRPDAIPWEERYEKIWVDNEKKETKSQFKNVAAELKERFGELEQEQLTIEEDSSEEEADPIVRPTARARSAKLMPIPEQRESDSQSESVQRSVSIEASDAELDKHNSQINQKTFMEIREDENKEADEKYPEESESDSQEPPLHVKNEQVTAEALGEVSSSDPEEVDEAMWKPRLEADDMRGNLKPGAFWDTGRGGDQAELDQGKRTKVDTSSENPKPKFDGIGVSRTLEREGSVSPKLLKGDAKRAAQHEDEQVKEKEEKRTIASKDRNLCVPSSQAANRRNGDLDSVFDDSSLSELSEEDRSSPSSKKKKEQSPEELEMPDEFEDLTQSSDTATEELETPLSGYRNASLLFKQLDSSYLDSVSVVKLQNMFHEYERTIQRERDRHARLAEKNSQLEQERNELKNLLEEIRGSKSNLEHLRLELETDMNNIKFLLRQEQEKHQSSIMLYNKTREQLQRKEEQQRDEAEERHKAELIVRSLELEIRALKNTVKQLEEDRDESQRLLAHERSARVLQEDLLNNHLRKQQDIQEENMRNLNRSNEAMSQLTEASDRERELMLQNRTLLDELSAARAELERSHSHSQQEESRLVDERDALRERLEDARRDLKLSEDALAQTVFQYNGQLSTLKAESSVCTSRLEHERQLRQQTEAEAETGRARLQAAIQEAERCQREREEHQRVQEKHLFESSAQRDTLQSLSQQLSKVEARANNLENECHRNALTLAEKNLLLETLARDKEQALSKLKDLEGAVQSEREQSCRAQVKQESMQERLVQAQSEAALLRQQLEEALNKGSAKDRAVTDVQQNFSEMLNQLRADGEDRVQMVEERSRELAKSNGELREQNYKLEQEKADREAAVRQLQQELADSLKKLSMCEASLEVNTRYRNDLEEEKTRNLKDMDRLKAKLQEGEESLVQAERRIAQMKSSLEDRERDACSTTQKLQEAISESATREQSVRQLEEAVQRSVMQCTVFPVDKALFKWIVLPNRLEIENARLEAVVKQQENRIEVLQRGAQEGAVMRNRLEDLVTNLQSNKMTLEEQLNREVQKQSMLSHNAQDSQALWEEELKSRSRLGLRLSELEKEKGELTNQMELEKKKAKKLSEQKKCVDGRLEQEMQRNSDLQKEMYRMKTLLKSAKKQLRSQPAGHPESPVLQSLRGDTENTVIRMKMRVEELQSQLERESSRSSALEQSNRELKQKVSALKSRIVKPLEASGGGVMDQSQAEQYRKETEERARQEIRQKLEEVNLFLQTQAASQEALDQLKAASEASQRSQMEQRIRTLEDELSRSRTQHQDALVQRETNVTELQRFKQLYGEELRLRKSLADKLHRSSERLAEANAKLLSERQRSKSLLCSGVVNASCLDGSSLGHLNRSLSITTPLMGTLGDAQSHRVEAYLAKMQTELERNISKELDYGELGGGSARLSPVGSASSSQTHPLTLGQEPPDPLSRATQQYLEVLKKNYRI